MGLVRSVTPVTSVTTSKSAHVFGQRHTEREPVVEPPHSPDVRPRPQTDSDKMDVSSAPAAQQAIYTFSIFHFPFSMVHFTYSIFHIPYSLERTSERANERICEFARFIRSPYSTAHARDDTVGVVGTLPILPALPANSLPAHLSPENLS